MTALSEKGGGRFTGIKLQSCGNPLSPIAEVIIRFYIKPLRLTGQDKFYFDDPNPDKRLRCSIQVIAVDRMGFILVI